MNEYQVGHRLKMLNPLTGIDEEPKLALHLPKNSMIPGPINYMGSRIAHPSLCPSSIDPASNERKDPAGGK